jgi:hypothetical protein
MISLCGSAGFHGNAGKKNQDQFRHGIQNKAEKFVAGIK